MSVIKAFSITVALIAAVIALWLLSAIGGAALFVLIPFGIVYMLVKDHKEHGSGSIDKPQ